LELWLALELAVRNTLERHSVAGELRILELLLWSVHDARRRGSVSADDADSVSTAASIRGSGSCHHNDQTDYTRDKPIFCEAAHFGSLYVFDLFSSASLFLACLSAQVSGKAGGLLQIFPGGEKMPRNLAKSQEQRLLLHPTGRCTAEVFSTTPANRREKRQWGSRFASASKRGSYGDRNGRPIRAGEQRIGRSNP
jgi:hypothetical protein